MSWTLEVNNKLFYDKIKAIKEHNISGGAIKFNTPKNYDNFDFSVEPKESLENLCLQNIKDIRHKHEAVHLWYSGGCDSHYILELF